MGSTELVFPDFLDGIDIRQEDCAAAVLLQAEIIEDLFLVLSLVCTFLELLPFVADDLATGETSYRYLHSIYL